MDASLVRKLAGTWMFFIRSILGFSWVAISANRWSHDDLQRMLGVPSLLTLMQRRLASWIGHLVRMDLARVPRQVLFGMVTSRRFPSSTQTTRRHSYQSRVNALLQQLPGVNFRIWFQQAQDRSFWASAVKALCIVPQTRSVGRAFDALCLAVFVGRNAQGLQRHTSEKHATRKSFRCEFCGADFTLCSMWSVVQKQSSAWYTCDTQTSINHGLALPPLIIFIYSTVWKGT